jgi:hypothetical protein
MNKFFTRIAIGGSLILALILVIQVSGCAKDKPCKGNITVLDASNNPVSGAVVHLTAPSSTTDISTSTDASGRASFEVNLPQILDISVLIGVQNYVTGKVVRFEQGKTDDVTVNI